MRLLTALVGLLVVFAADGASASDVYKKGYYRNNGTYVQPHYATRPNNTLMDNYSTRGNVNPYTGKAGTVNPYTYQTPSYPAYGSQRRN